MQARFRQTLCSLNPQQLSEISNALLVPGLTTELILLAEKRHAEFVSCLEGHPIMSTTSFYIFKNIRTDDPLIHVALREFATLISSAIYTLNLDLEPEAQIFAKIKREIIADIKDSMISEEQVNGLQDIIDILLDPYLPDNPKCLIEPWTCRALAAEKARAPKTKPTTRNFLGDMVEVELIECLELKLTRK